MIATAIPRSFLPLKATETNQKAELASVSMADFTCAIAVRLASPTLTGRDIKTWHRAHVTTANHQIQASENQDDPHRAARQ
jgi:hypothetical protein